MKLNREQHEQVHYLLSKYKENASFYGYLSNHKIISNYWETRDYIDITEHEMLRLNSPNIAYINIPIDGDVIRDLLSKDITMVMHQLILNTVNNFNIEDYFRGYIHPTIEDYAEFGSSWDVHDLVMDDGELFREIAFELRKTLEAK